MNGLCECGCGQLAPISSRTHRRYGWVKGQPKRFIKGHFWRGKSGQAAPAFGHEVSASARLRIGAAQRGRKASLQTRKKLSEARTGENNSGWKGSEVGYKGLHMWVNSHKVKSGKCSTCSFSGPTEWANISGLYFRDLDDFAEMCKDCHREFDGRA
jgi:NUMOD3 motif